MNEIDPGDPSRKGTGTRGGSLRALGGAALATALLVSGALHPAPEPPAPSNAVVGVSVERCEHNPLIVRDQDPRVGDNVNGPSLLRVPDWVENPLGRYYLYFAHHRGKSIRLAYADTPCGAWTVHDAVLQLGQIPTLEHHIASPDVHVDETRRQILMYLHGRRRPGKGQESALAVSKDGLRFENESGRLGLPYLRRFDWRGEVFAIAGESAKLVRSPGGREPFVFERVLMPRVRHAAVLRRGNRLLVFFSRIGDAPERILVSSMALDGDPSDWRMSAPLTVLSPETRFEGGDLPLRASQRGLARAPLHELRDPGIHEEDGRVWLFYSVAGEAGLAVAELQLELELEE